MSKYFRVVCDSLRGPNGSIMQSNVWSRFERHFTRLAFFPGLWFCRAMAGMRLWRTWHRVDPHLIIGAFPSVCDLRELHAMGVRIVINLCEEHPGNVAALKSIGLRQCWVPCLDFRAPRAPQIWSAIDAIRQEARVGRTTYLHCKAGRLRSAIVAMAWLIQERGLAPADAARLLRAQRRQVDGRLLRRMDWAEFARTTGSPHCN